MDESVLLSRSPRARLASSSKNRTPRNEDGGYTPEVGGADPQHGLRQRMLLPPLNGSKELADRNESTQSAGNDTDSDLNSSNTNFSETNKDSSASDAGEETDATVQRRERRKYVAARKRNLIQTSTNSMLVVSARSNSQILSPGRRRKGYSTPRLRSRNLSNPKAFMFSKIREFKIDFVLPNGSLLPYTCHGDWTVKQIKAEVWAVMRDLKLLDECLENMDSYVFKYEKDNDMYELYEERQIFQTLSVVVYWRVRNVEAGRFEIAPIRVETPQEMEINKEIGRLIGINLNELSTRKKDEVTMTRRIFMGVRRSAVSSRDPSYYSTEPELCLTPIPLNIKNALDSSGKVILKIYSGEVFTALRVPYSHSPFQILQDFFPKDPRKRQRLNLKEDSEIKDFILKVCDRNIFLTGPDKIINFLYVRNCLATSRSICLAIIPCIDSEKDQPRKLPEPDLIDDYTGLAGSYRQLSGLTKDHTQVFTLASWDVGQKFRVLVRGIDGLEEAWNCVSLLIEIGIFYGGKSLVENCKTNEIRYATNPRWSQYLNFDIKTKNIPKAARLVCNVTIRKFDTKKHRRFSTIPRSQTSDDFAKWSDILQHSYHATLQLFDYRSILHQGQIQLPLRDVMNINSTQKGSPVLHIKLDQYAHPVAYPNSDEGWSLANNDIKGFGRSVMSTKCRFMVMIREIIASDPLKELEVHECELLWRFRGSLVEIPEALPWLLRCVDWGSLESVLEIHRLLQNWKSSEITLEVALQLLNSNCVDENVRSLAVDRLERLSNDEMLFYLLQLVQVLKFEPHHDSALARFLLRRALSSKRIGHFFYWFLRSELDFPDFRDRFSLLLEAYLRGCGEAALAEIKNQHRVFNFLAEVAKKLKSIDKKDRVGFLADSLKNFNLPEMFSPAYDPSLRIGNLQVDDCKFMDSKKIPLWLEFTNMDPTAIKDEKIQLIFKHGDDLRQDMLTLQMLKLMDKLWKEEGLNLYIVPYGCMSTGFEVGMIEVVTNSSTVARIQRTFGGSFGAFKDDCLCNWLKKHNPRSADFQAAVKRFTLSCAGYCVATFVLGIGDRHNDNILLTESGNLVHIDFGHFLGNTKTFMGIKRERAPFVLTPDFVYIMGKKNGDMFRLFQTVCAKAFNVIRRNAHLFINLFSMMKHTGIPELRSVEDIDYLRNILVLNKSEADAAKYFGDKVEECLRLSWSTQLNWLAHNVVHN